MSNPFHSLAEIGVIPVIAIDDAAMALPLAVLVAHALGGSFPLERWVVAEPILVQDLIRQDLIQQTLIRKLRGLTGKIRNRILEIPIR